MENEDGKKVRIRYGGQDQLTVEANSETFTVLKGWLETALPNLKIEQRQIKQIIVVADEICSNIVSYAYDENESDKTLIVTMDFTSGDNLLTLTFRDHGEAFDPLAAQHELPTERIKKRIPGGLGLFLVQKFMDHLEYHRDGNCNVLMLSKKMSLEPDGAGA